MAVAVVGVAVMMFTLFALSDHYAEPVRAELSGSVVLEDSDARLVRAAWVEPSGREVHEPAGSGCPRRVDAGRSSRNAEAWQECLFGKGYRYAVYYHPASRFWRFQWTEAGILLIAAAVVGGRAGGRVMPPTA
jgi:hypothetical protein